MEAWTRAPMSHWMLNPLPNLVPDRPWVQASLDDELCEFERKTVESQVDGKDEKDAFQIRRWQESRLHTPG